MNYFQTEEFSHVKSAMAIYHNTTGIPCILINEEGETLHAEGARHGYCLRLEQLADSGNMCQGAHFKSSQQSVNLGEAYISYCPAGLVYFTVAISSGMVFKGAVIAGPIHMSEPDSYEVSLVAEKYGLNEVIEEELVEKYKKIQMMPPATARYHLKLLTVLAKDIMKDSAAVMERKKAFYDEQRQISEQIQALKVKEHRHTLQPEAYPIQMEKDLSTAIIKGNEAEAKQILNNILGIVFYKYRGDNRKIISRTMELLVVMSRAAVDGGARYDDVSKVTQDILLRASDSEDIESVCLWLMDGLEKIILFVFPMHSENQEQIGILRKAVIYMNQHLEEAVTLDQVAEHVGLSATYFSRLFSTEMKMTYIEYLTKIKIEESKKYLVDTKESISDIAIRLGFSDQSYFSKVFKKVEGMTPGKYRKMYL